MSGITNDGRLDFATDAESRPSGSGGASRAAKRRRPRDANGNPILACVPPSMHLWMHGRATCECGEVTLMDAHRCYICGDVCDCDGTEECVCCSDCNDRDDDAHGKRLENGAMVLKRYDLITYYRCGQGIEEMTPADDGEWVRYEDVEAALTEARELEACAIAALRRC